METEEQAVPNRSENGWVAEWLTTTSMMLDETSNLLKEFATTWKSSGEPEQSEAYRDVCSSVQGKMFSAIGELTSILDELYPSKSVPWLPEDDCLLKNMTFLRGRSPWSLFLGYALPINDIFKGFSADSLQKYMGNPRPGIFICCFHHEKLFRGFLVGLLSANRFKVVNIDTSEVSIVPKSAIHHLPKALCSTHALSIHCTLLKNDENIINIWSEDLEGIFLSTLRNQTLHVKVIECFPDSPPKYLVEVEAASDKYPDLDLTAWLRDYLIHDIKQHYHLVITKDELIFFLRDESVDPFLRFQTAQNRSIIQDLHMGKIELYLPPSNSPSLADCSTIVEISGVKVGEDQEIQLQSSSTRMGPGAGERGDDTYLAYQFDVLERRNPSSESRRRPGQRFYQETRVPDGSCVGNTEAKPHLPLPAEHKSPSAAKTEAKPHLPLLAGGIHSSVVKTEPTHRPLTAWDVTNKINVPRVGERVEIRITRVESDLSFYVLLDNIYSDYDGDTGPLETYNMLINRLNNPAGTARRQPLQNCPEIGQLVIYVGDKHKWCRGIIVNIDASRYTIFNPDRGTIVVTPADPAILRPAERDDTVLPYQAIRTSLYRTSIADGQDHIKAVEYFITLTSSKDLYAVVRNIIIEDWTMPLLEVDIFTADEVNVNEALVSAGMCIKVPASQ